MKNIIDNLTQYQGMPMVALAACDSGIVELETMQKDLHFAGDELQRMENESGIPLSREQIANVSIYFKLMHRMKKLLRLARRRLPKKSIQQYATTTR